MTVGVIWGLEEGCDLDHITTDGAGELSNVFPDVDEESVGFPSPN